MKNTIFLLLLLSIISCNKNQKIQKSISGKWQYQGITTLTGGAEVYTSISNAHTIKYDFQNCNLKNNDYCSLIITDILKATSTSETITEKSIYSKIYKIYSDGAIIEIKNNLSDSISQTYLLTELDDQKLIFTYYEDGSRVDLDFYKVE